jgi:hypothetical protein
LILHLLHPVSGYTHHYCFNAILGLTAGTRPIPAMLFLLYAFHIPPHLILLHNSVPCYIIKSSVDDICYVFKMNTLHIQDELVPQSF